MTATVALDLADPQELFTISQEAAARPPTKLVMMPGQRMKLSELLYALLLTSANDIVAQPYEYLPSDENHKLHDLHNFNGLLCVYPGAKGVKIGNTRAAGATTVVLAEREVKKVLVVLLGAPGKLERDLWAANLLDLGFEKLGIPPVNITKNQLQDKYSSWKLSR